MNPIRSLCRRIRAWWHVASGAAVDEARADFHESTIELRRASESLDRTTTGVWLSDPRRRDDDDLLRHLRRLGPCSPAPPGKERK